MLPVLKIFFVFTTILICFWVSRPLLPFVHGLYLEESDQYLAIYTLLDATAISREGFVSVPSCRTTRPPKDGFSLNWVFEDFSKSLSRKFKFD